MVDKVFPITGNKISAFILDENSVKFSSSTEATVDNFRNAFSKKLSLAYKREIKYNSIRYISKEDNSKKIIIHCKAFRGISINCEFTFNEPADYEIFFIFFEKERYFTRIHEILTPFRAIVNHLFGLMIITGITVFAYYQSIQIADGTVEEASDYKTRLFNYIVGLLGYRGVLAVGGLLFCYICYKMWVRYTNPPSLLKLLPPNS